MSERKQALEALLAKVEAGDAVTAHDASRLWPNGYTHAINACHGSLDAAKALHEAVLPDIGWEVYRTAKYPGMIPGSCPSPYKAIVGWGTQVSGHADNPARAWLIAVLRALIAGYA